MSDTNVLILREFLAADGDFVSGSQLAELIGVSRVSVWSYMEKLKAQGFDFEAVRSKGYRLTQVPDTLNQALIQARLQHAAEDYQAIVLDEVDSTNSEAERRIANGECTPFVVLSRLQTVGRGRLGREWHSPQNGNLYSSFAFRPQISPSQMSLFTLWMGINICECINSLCQVSCKIKWPNDLHIDGKKVAGILTEARMEADIVLNVVLGLGLNVNSDGADWPAELKEIATSLSQSSGRTFDINKLVSTLTGRIAIAYKKLLDGSHRTELKERWSRYDTLNGKEITLLQGESRISGTANGIDSNGSLIIERPDGTRYLARAGEVTIEKK
ncbi:biotin--[acetyl-CoA-carboxylase] ligase [Pelagicoccus mobilis]|uniref:Bifunctional ligase/repressor BirA n=1 Tax=Pelagicoccus mobilis TaxID=415221 RepID=A0A934RZR9_9BACT|nr:biotin--[acetyl-CoA-carboxylase] ligase [Pelagicoccus mobilis]MBK1877891.1 biotin--[acetyl-CoA-carboxylase] ligase [Pelagicoccus mobilis]